MRIAVVGLGGVGAYIAAYLSRSDNEIVGFARGRHLEAIKKHGITIIEDKDRFNAKLYARELSEADGYFDAVLFCTKSYDLVDAYNKISPYIDLNSIILSFSNGVNNGDVLRKLSKSIVVDACIYILSHIQKSGVIRKNGNVFNAVFGGDEKAGEVLKNVFEKVNLSVRVPRDIKKALYKKYIFISAFATLTTYFDESIVQVCESHLQEVKKTLQEIASVAFAQGVDIRDEVEKSLNIAKSLPYELSTSMHLDYKNKKKMELESLCAYVVKEGDRHMVDTPMMKMMYKKLAS